MQGRYILGDQRVAPFALKITNVEAGCISGHGAILPSGVRTRSSSLGTNPYRAPFPVIAPGISRGKKLPNWRPIELAANRQRPRAILIVSGLILTATLAIGIDWVQAWIGGI